MSETFWAGIVGSLIGGMFALLGGLASSWQSKKQLERQLAHADASRMLEIRTVAYEAVLTTSDKLFFATIRYITEPDLYAPMYEECRNNFRAAKERVTLVAPEETVKHAQTLSEKLSQMLNQQGTHESQERATHARLRFWTAARVDLGIDDVGDHDLDMLPGIRLPRPEEVRQRNREARRQDGFDD